jgi:hypothetical protein
MRITALVSILLVAPGLTACSPFLEVAANSAGLPSPTRLVEGKIPPDLLVARDGSRCRVPRARFEKIQPGQHVTCVWTREGASSHVITRPPGHAPGPPWSR